MTAPSYTTDLSDVTTAESTTSWAELSGHTGGGSPTQESDYFIQGSYCVSQSTGNKTGTACGLQFDHGSNISLSAGDCFFFWIMCLMVAGRILLSILRTPQTIQMALQLVPTGCLDHFRILQVL